MSTQRNDRTVRALERLVGRERAGRAMTHLAERKVAVVAGTVIGATPNGTAAVRVAMNMLRRFVGRVDLVTVEALDAAVASHSDVLLAIGIRPTPGDAQPSGERVICVAFDAWRCALQRGWLAHDLPASRSSEIPFGALVAACFGTAEVFKTLLASFLDPVEAATFRRRFTRRWAYSAWRQERVPFESEWGGNSGGPAELLTVRLDGVLQIGAGAVGNAAAYALAVTVAVEGTLPVLDVKEVDEKNLNRCLCFEERHVGARKVDVLEELSRPGLVVHGYHEPYSELRGRKARVLLSTVDNNEVRHQMQETLPAYLVQGSTSETRIAVSVHTAVDGRSCLVCRHPDRARGAERVRPLSVEETARITALAPEVVATGKVNGSMAITDGLIAQVRARAPEMGAMLVAAREDGRDLCGALGDLRVRFGTREGPREASVPFVSVLAGVLCAAEVVKLQLKEADYGAVPILGNVVELDLARDYARHKTVSFREPAVSDCALCQDRASEVHELYRRRHGEVPSL